MPSFSEMFEKSEELTIDYRGNTLIQTDKFPVNNGDRLILSIESTNSDTLQGVAIEIAGYCKMAGELFKKGKRVIMVFWEKEDVYDPKDIELTVFTKKDFVLVKNIWETEELMGNRYFASGHTGAAMIVEEIENGRRYRCNDWHPDDDFDDIIFTVTRVS